MPKSIPSELSSPWTTSAQLWVLAGTGATALLLIFEDQIVDPVQSDVSSDRPLGGWSKVGDYAGRMIPNLAYVAGMAGYGFLENDDRAKNRAYMMTRASLYAISTTTLLKYTVRESRPNNRSNTKSFPSGHSTAAFAFSSFIVAEHGLLPYGAAALALSTLTAISRMNDNQHFLHDVVAGATIGAAFGLGVSYLHKKAESGTGGESFASQIEFSPLLSGSERGVQLGYKF